MAKTPVNTKSKDYLRDKDVFLKELKHFNDSKSIPYKIPNINGVDIDLYLFYTLVQQRGGINKVNQSDAFDTFLRPLRLPFPCINGTTLLRRIYNTYLEKFERARGPPGRDDDNDMDDDPRGRTRYMPRASFGAYISASGETIRSGAPRAIAGPSERLALSLLSPMPNEQDFAINVCTVLAADYANRLPLSSTPHILDFLLAHAGVYNHASLRDTIGRSYFEVRGRYPHEFWELRAGGGGARELADEAKFTAPGLEQPELVVQAMAAQNTLSDRLRQADDVIEMADKVIDEDVLEDWVTEPSEEDQLFAPELPGGAKCVYTQRVLQVASIVRSLSFHEENVQYLARNTTLLRFLLLCSNCWVGTLRQSGLDTLGNVCTELVIKDPATCLISRHVLSTIQTALASPDRARILAALEMLNKLAQNETNEDVLIKALEAKVYNDVCSLLTLRDIMVLVCTLECVYALTSLGERASECVARVSGLIHTLVSLVTVEAQSYGPKACILMRVVETVSGPAPVGAAAEQPQPPTSTTSTTSSEEAQPKQFLSSPAVSKPAAPPPAPAPTPAPAPPAPPAQVSVAPTNTLQQQHMQQRTVQENEQFALAWLRASYEALPPNDNSGIDAGEVYRQYLACCTKLGRKGVIAPLHFPRLVRTTFGGTVGPNTVTIPSKGESTQMYVGIRSKNPGRTAQAPGPASPILKAQLTNTNDARQQPQSTSHPTLSQALESGSSNTSLIKHLLAHKVSPATNTLQVAQRQQNQQKAVLPTNTVIQQQVQNSIELDPEALIKCTTIIPGGVASTGQTESKIIVTSGEDTIVPKEEPLDEHGQINAQKTTQNKMLADLLEKKSNPPVQVVQMAAQSINAPTIQITETGQIVQVKPDPTPVLQINPDSGQILGQSPFYQVKNEQGQVIQLKNDQGQIIQLKADQISGQILLKSDQLLSRVKSETEHIVESVNYDHAYTEPPSKKAKVEVKREKSPQESVSKTAANLYAALAASALEDEEDLLPPKQEDVIQQPVIVASGSEATSVIIQEPILQVQQPTLQVQQPTMQVQNTLQVQQQIQVQQPMLQVQPMDVQNIIATQSGQLILQQDKQMPQQTHIVQQPMQIIATPNAQPGLSYITQNIPSNMVQKTIIIVQGATSGGPITLTVNNPGGLDEATLNQVIAQATEAITQQQIIQNSGVIQSAQRVIVSQPALVPATQQITMVKAAQNPPQLSSSQQPTITAQPQPHKAQLVMAQKTPALIATTSSNQIIQGSQQLMQGSQQIIAVSNNQQIIMNAPMKTAGHRVISQTPRQVISQADSKTTVIQSTGVNPATGGVVRQVISRQPVMVAGTKIGDKEMIITQPAETIPPKSKTPTPKPVATPPPLHINSQEDTPWICHWKGCGKSFESASAVFSHCARAHCPSNAALEAPCLWLDCDRVPRRTFALLNHINDRHCTREALKAVFNSRRHITAEAETNKPVSLGYPPNAAMAALNKNAVEFLNPRELMQRADSSRNAEQTDENEGPVTKSIRLTAALILRNLVIYSNTGRRHLRSYEAHLATIALSNVEASRTIAQVLYDMNNI